VKKNSKSVNNW